MNLQRLKDLRNTLILLEELLFANKELFEDEKFIDTFAKALKELADVECFFSYKKDSECTIDDITGSIMIDNKDLVLDIAINEYRRN